MHPLENPLTKGKITTDLLELRRKVESRYIYKENLQIWYESFRDSRDSLISSYYSIYHKDVSIRLFSKLSTFSYHGETAYLRYLIDESEDVKIAAEAYLLSLKIPFLEDLLTTYDSIVIGPKNVYIEPQPEIQDTPKSKKKTTQLTTKQQMILLYRLGILDLSVLSRLTTQHKAAILSNLLHRSEQEIRSMLTYWQNSNAPQDYDCSQPKDYEVVDDFLADNNLLP